MYEFTYFQLIYGIYFLILFIIFKFINLFQILIILFYKIDSIIFTAII